MNTINKIIVNGWGDEGSMLMIALKKSIRKDRELVSPPIIRKDTNSLGVVVSWIDRRIVKGKPCQNMYKSMCLKNVNQAKEVVQAFVLEF